MFGKKTTSSNLRSGGKPQSLSQYGLLDIPDIGPFGSNMDDDANDESLEAELAMISKNTSSKPKSTKAKSKLVPDHVLNKMVEESLKDYSDSDISSGDEDDLELLGEFNQLTATEDVNDDEPKSESIQQSSPSYSSNENTNMLSILETRLQMYELASKNAKNAGEEAKLRRINRGIKTIQDLSKQIKSGKNIDESEIPPPVSVGSSNSNPPNQSTLSSIVHPEPESIPELPVPAEIIAVPIPEVVEVSPPPVPPRSNQQQLVVAPHETNNAEVPSPEKKQKSGTNQPTSSDNSNDPVVRLLLERQAQYKKCALESKRNGDVQTALRYVKIVKQFDVALKGAQEGNPVDLNSIPPPPPDSSPNITKENIGTPLMKNENALSSENSAVSESVGSESQNKQIILDALEQRLSVYKEIEKTAKESNDSRKARQTSRIISTYQDAIRMHKAGKNYDYESLAVPFGFPPLPIEKVSPATTVESNVSQVKESNPVLPSQQSSSSETKIENVPPNVDKIKNAKSGAITRSEKQTKLLIERQKLFKIAALKAKKNNEMEHAKEYLRQCKQFDKLIEASECGLPVDMNTVPIPPDDKLILESDFDVVTLNSCIPGSNTEVFEKLESDLKTQIEMCLKTRDHFKAIGDIASCNRFEQLTLNSTNDLLTIQLAHLNNKNVPKFHYESKPFTIIQCNTDLTDNDLEVTIGHGISYNVSNPKDVDTYVKLNFPYPTENPQLFKTSTIYDTNNPVYNTVHSFQIQRNARACQRIFKRHALKCEVWSRGGFFRSDSLIGVATVKLLPLETHCTIHDAYDLMENRRTSVGKLEVKIRIRNPILTKQVEQVQQKWLIIDN